MEDELLEALAECERNIWAKDTKKYPSPFKMEHPSMRASLKYDKQECGINPLGPVSHFKARKRYENSESHDWIVKGSLFVTINGNLHKNTD